MVALKRLFHVERSPLSPAPREKDSPVQSPPRRNLSLRGIHNQKKPLSLDETEQFQKIERQFELMHDQLQAGARSSRHTPLSRVSSRLANRNPRHIDLLEALLSSHRNPEHSFSSQVSPISLYNEDVAERNMAPFLQGQQPRGQSVHSRLLSVLYQEDVADRNIARNRRRSRSLTRGTTRSRVPPSWTSQTGSYVHGSDVGDRPHSRTNDNQMLGYTPLESIRSTPNLRLNKLSPGVHDAASSSGGLLRTQRSAPTILSEQATTHSQDTLSSKGQLGIPPAHKQGNTWSNTPLPDSPTIPIIMGQGKNSPNQNKEQPSSQPGLKTPNSRIPASPSKRKPPISPRNSKKNVRGLSINVELASRGRPKKIAHRAIQPPTPTGFDMKQNPSIAEIMNSPLLTATSTSLSPLPTSNQKFAEIMDMFRQAYSSTQIITPHPTFETLQDAIVREINSHEAFRKVPVPEAGPPFTPSPSQDSFDRGTPALKPPGPASLKDGQLSKLIRKGSFKRSRKGSERKSISTSVPYSVFRRVSEPPSRRRHTDAPPPSPGLFDTLDLKKEEPVTYMDLILRSEKSREAKNRTASMSHSHAMGTIPSGHLSATPSVLCMRAQTTSSSSNDGINLKEDDSDDEILHLPSVGIIPHVQIQGVDENNVTYVAENTTPQNAYRLMNWPRTSSGRSRSISLRGTYVSGDSRTSQVPKNRENPIESY